jgi:hypothetical protein
MSRRTWTLADNGEMKASRRQLEMLVSLIKPKEKALLVEMTRCFSIEEASERLL